jgi:hypothetical protein
MRAAQRAISFFAAIDITFLRLPPLFRHTSLIFHADDIFATLITMPPVYYTPLQRCCHDSAALLPVTPPR